MQGIQVTLALPHLPTYIHFGRHDTPVQKVLFAQMRGFQVALALPHVLMTPRSVRSRNKALVAWTCPSGLYLSRGAQCYIQQQDAPIACGVHLPGIDHGIPNSTPSGASYERNAAIIQALQLSHPQLLISNCVPAKCARATHASQKEWHKCAHLVCKGL